MFWRQRTQSTLQCKLLATREKNCACERVRGEVYCSHTASLTREPHFLVSETPCTKLEISVSTSTLRRSTRIATLSMRLKKKKVTTAATSTAVLFDDVLGMASVESGSSAGSEDCFVVQSLDPLARSPVQQLLPAPCPPTTPFFVHDRECGITASPLSRRRHLAEADQLARTPLAPVPASRWASGRILSYKTCTTKLWQTGRALPSVV